MTNADIPVTGQANIANYNAGMWTAPLLPSYPANATYATSGGPGQYAPSGGAGDPRATGAFFSIGVPTNLLAPSYTGGSNIVTQAAQTPLGAGVLIGLVMLFKH